MRVEAEVCRVGFAEIFTILGKGEGRILNIDVCWILALIEQSRLQCTCIPLGLQNEGFVRELFRCEARDLVRRHNKYIHEQLF